MSALDSSITVLIVDDEIDICYLLNDLLQRNNIDSSFVHSLSTAKAVLHNEQPSLVLLDNHLSDGMGMDLIPYIKFQLPNTKIIMITAYDGLAERENALQSGASDFISKPFTKDEILRTLRRWL